jgi:hypothetical protein
MGVLVVSEDVTGLAPAVASSGIYHGLVLALLTASFLGALGIDLPWGDRAFISQQFIAKTGLGLARWMNFFGLSLIVVYPLFRCFFKVPWLFCHVCPRKCVFGFFRPYLIPAAVLMNLSARHWCHRCCPVGTLLHCQGKSLFDAPNAKRCWWQWLTPIGILAFVAAGYFRMRQDFENRAGSGLDLHAFFAKETFSFSPIVVIVAIGVVLLGFVWRRAFCHLLCPVGTLGWLYLRLEQWMARRQKN